MTRKEPHIHGRGSQSRPAGRFERFDYDGGDDFAQPDDAGVVDPNRPPTEFLRDNSRSIIARNDSPDVGFDASINPYRGCEHGCVYCFARPTHEFLGLSAGLDFETKIFVKHDAPALLRAALQSPSWNPQVLGVSGVTDPYQPVERRLGLTRGCLEVLAEFGNPAVVITKNHLVTRDADLLGSLAGSNAARVFVSITTLDAALARTMEPRTSSPARRLDAIAALTAAGVPTGVLVAPVIPGLTDHEVPGIIAAAARAGATRAGYVMLRLPHGVKSIFAEWLAVHQPERREKILSRMRAVRDGKLYDARFGDRLRGSGIFARQIAEMFALACRRHGMNSSAEPLSTAAFRRPPGPQRDLFNPGG
ncbi:MAG TPA: PA0069 family radical SAM protein [Candidatus Krumholzibacteria bacterium]|nr:PA0069 family radical SAM protein [Candidatus Krumholzibacteria bacterium]